MKRIFIFSVIFLFSVILTANSYGNNLQVSSVSLTEQNVTSDFVYIKLNLSWENSWRDGINWDAAWIFVKFKKTTETIWNHATLNANPVNHSIPAGYTCSPASTGVGILIYRESAGSGNVNLSGVKLRWQYGANGVGDHDIVELKVFAVEMVYVPSGSFYAGDGNTTDVRAQFSQGNTSNPFQIINETEITLGGTSISNLGNRNAATMSGDPDDFNYSVTQTLPSGYPKGVSLFYCMKYEISQGQYTDFLNTLTRTQQINRVTSDISGDAVTNFYVMSNTAAVSNRNTITCPASGNGTTQPIVFSCDRSDRSCNFLSWMDGCAYFDWAGLRPMSELEFEKVCRGPLTPVAQENAWGDINIFAATDISGTENGTETITNSDANCCYYNQTFSGGDGGVGPLRCGIFSTSSTITRNSSGATYYGIMEMSGNVKERCVTVGNATGRSFTGSKGDGTINSNGNATNSDWPGYFSGEVTGSEGSNVRGGSFSSPNSIQTQVSFRYWGAHSYSSRDSDFGIRGVR